MRNKRIRKEEGGIHKEQGIIQIWDDNKDEVEAE